MQSKIYSAILYVVLPRYFKLLVTVNQEFFRDLLTKATFALY
jgi:hypothetical protein